MKKGVVCIISFFIMLFSGVLPSIADVAGDINADGKVGLKEAINALNVTVGLRAVSSDTTYDIVDYSYSSDHDYLFNEEKYESDTISESTFTASVSEQTINDQNMRVVTYDGGSWAGMQEYAVYDGESLTVVGWHITFIPRTYWYTPGYIRGKSDMHV